MKPFMHHLSMAETMGSVYGQAPRVITALSSIAASIAIVAMQINVVDPEVSFMLFLAYREKGKGVVKEQ
ncbi:hypothetical protein [Cardinium endosymbiont of Tipula unca]|uniref:hypothetical protein n=1 Tax=Cardinium endosymbiont of Tipula unca TaxID=3066216 RepID=UPI0030CBBD63